MIECDATLSALVEKVAWPPLRLPVPKVVAPSLNVTVPEGVPLPGDVAETVAVNVTDCPETEGLWSEVTPVVVSALFTVCETAGEFVLPLKLLLPANSAVIEWEPTLNELLESVATLPLNVPVPKVVAPSLNVTDPLTVPLPGEVTLTVAV